VFINYHSKIIGEIDVRDIVARDGIGVMRLGFRVDWNLQKKLNTPVSIWGTWVSVAIRTQGESAFKPLGVAMPEVAFAMQSSELFASRQDGLYYLNVTHAQLLELEHWRGGKGVDFQLDVCGYANGEHGPAGVKQTGSLFVEVSRWVRLLADAGVADTLLVGVTLPIKAVSKRSAAVIDTIHSAHKNLLSGEYDAATGKCRKAIEAVFKEFGLLATARAARERASSSDGRNMDKSERLLAVAESLRHFCHLAVHADGDGKLEVFSRTDAALAVAGTASVVASLLNRKHAGRE
jgi:hypothetical protein